MLEAFVTVLFTSPLPVALVILGVLCVALAIVGKISPINLDGLRSVALGTFGGVLILIAIFTAFLLAITTTSSKVAASTSVPPTNAPVQITAGSPLVFTVYADKDWQDTGYVIQTGDTVEIKYLSGECWFN